MLCPRLACCQSEAARHHIPGLYALSARDLGQAARLGTNCASFWQPESMWPWRRHDSACASRPRAQPIRTRSRTPWPCFDQSELLPADRSGFLRGWPASPWLGGMHSLAGACCPSGGLADCRRPSARLLQPDAADDERAGWSLGNRPVGNDRGPAAGGQLSDRDRRGPDCRAHACAHPADPDWAFYSRHRRHSGTGHQPDVPPSCLRGELRRHDGGLARTCRQARASATVDRQCLRLRDGDRDLRRAV